MSSIKKLKKDPGAIQSVFRSAVEDVPQRMAAMSGTAPSKWDRAGEVTEQMPHVLATSNPADKHGHVHGLPTESSGKRTLQFSLENAVPGEIVRVPLSLIDLNEFGPRQIYNAETVDKVSSTFESGQDDAAHGYVESGRVKLIDGGTRYHAAKDTSVGYLDVKIEEPPETKLGLYLRARELNDKRSQPSALDFALSLKVLLDKGAVESQRDIVENVPGPNGKKMTEGTVSKYLRIARVLPSDVRDRMSKSELTSGFSAAWEISELFADDPQGDLLTERTEMALGIIRAIVDDEVGTERMSTNKLHKLVRSKIDGPQTRERSVVHQLDLSGHKGHIKVFAKKGALDLSLRGLSEERLKRLRERLEATVKDFLADGADKQS